MSLVRARSIAAVIVGRSSIAPNDIMLFVGDKECLPFTRGVDGTLWSSLVDAMDAENLGRLAPGLFFNSQILVLGQKKTLRKTQAYLPCSLGATESSLRLGERRTLKLRVCSSFMCWCCIAVFKESTEVAILDVGTTSWVFDETFGCSRWNRFWLISNRCSMKIREGKSGSILWAWKQNHVWTNFNTNLVQCFYVIVDPLQPFSHCLGRSNVRAIRWLHQKSTLSLVWVIKNGWNTGYKEKKGTYSLSSRWG